MKTISLNASMRDRRTPRSDVSELHDVPGSTSPAGMAAAG